MEPIERTGGFRIPRRPRSLGWGLAAFLVAGLALPAFQAAAEVEPQIGLTSIIVKRVEGTTAAQKRLLILRDDVFQNEVLETGVGSASRIEFLDNTQVSVGPNSRLVLDRFVYDPSPDKGAFVMQLTEGVFRFVSGDMPSSVYSIQTPTVTIGVRGTVLVVVTNSLGEIVVILESDDGVTVDSVGGDSVVLDSAGLATVASADGGLSDPAAPPAWAIWRVREMDSLLAGNAPPPRYPDDGETEDEVEAAAVEPAVHDGRLRGLPRAAQNFDEGEPLSPGLEDSFGIADEHAAEPDPVPVGGVSAGGGPAILVTGSGSPDSGGGTGNNGADNAAAGAGNANGRAAR